MTKDEENFCHIVNTILWHLACDIGRSPPYQAPGLVAKALADIISATGRASVAKSKSPSDWIRSYIDKRNLEGARDALDYAIKQKNDLALALERSHQERSELAAELASTKELLASRNADVDTARIELAKLASDIRKLVDGVSTK